MLCVTLSVLIRAVSGLTTAVLRCNRVYVRVCLRARSHSCTRIVTYDRNFIILWNMRWTPVPDVITTPRVWQCGHWHCDSQNLEHTTLDVVFAPVQKSLIVATLVTYILYPRQLQNFRFGSQTKKRQPKKSPYTPVCLNTSQLDISTVKSPAVCKHLSSPQWLEKIQLLKSRCLMMDAGRRGPKHNNLISAVKDDRWK